MVRHLSLAWIFGLWISETASASFPFWDSGGASDNWSDAGNWEAGFAPVNGDWPAFGLGARTTNYVDYADLNLSNLAFAFGSPAFTIHVPESASVRQLTIGGALLNFDALEQTLGAIAVPEAGAALLAAIGALVAATPRRSYAHGTRLLNTQHSTLNTQLPSPSIP